MVPHTWGYRLVRRVTHRLRYRLLCAIVLLVLIQTALWAYFSWSVATPIARQQATRTLDDAVTSAAARVSQSMRAMDGISLQIVLNPQVQSALQHEAHDGVATYVERQGLENAIADTLIWSDLPVQVGVLGRRGQRYGAQLAMDWRTRLDPHFGAAQNENDQRSTLEWTSPYSGDASSGYPANERFIAAVRPVPDEASGDNIGLVVAELPVGQLGLQIPDVNANSHLALALLNPDGSMITGSDYGVPGKLVLSYWSAPSVTGEPRDSLIDWHGASYVMVDDSLSIAGWRVIGLMAWGEANLIVNQIERTLAALAVAVLALAVLFAWHISASVNRPLQRLLIGIRQIHEAQWSARVPVTPPDEIAELSAGFNEMAAQIEATLLSLRETQQRELTTRMEMLAGQINAHFLFNALEVIDCVAFKEGPEAVTRMVLALGNVLRYTLSPRHGEATLGEEIQQAESYLLIQCERFEEELSYRIEADDELRHCLLPRFSLQPLIENAIKHGTFPAHRPCTIVIRALKRGREMYVEIEDNGVGMSSERLAALRTVLLSESSDRLGIGLSNVYRRLQLCFGPTAGLDFERPLHGGLLVRLCMPVIYAEEEADASLARR